MVACIRAYERRRLKIRGGKRRGGSDVLYPPSGHWHVEAKTWDTSAWEVVYRTNDEFAAFDMAEVYARGIRQGRQSPLGKMYVAVRVTYHGEVVTRGGGKRRHSAPSRLGALVSDINRLTR
jgi:hypothetical protein